MAFVAASLTCYDGIREGRGGLSDAEGTDDGSKTGLGDRYDGADAGRGQSDPNLDVTHDETTFRSVQWGWMVHR